MRLLLNTFFILLLSNIIYSQDTIKVHSSSDTIKNIYKKALVEHVKINQHLLEKQGVILISESFIPPQELPDSILNFPVEFITLKKLIKATKKKKLLYAAVFEDHLLYTENPILMVSNMKCYSKNRKSVSFRRTDPTTTFAHFDFINGKYVFKSAKLGNK